MAAPVSDVNAVTEKYFMPKLVDDFFNANPVFFRLRENEMYPTGGPTIRQPIVYAANTNVGSYQGLDTLSIAETSEITAADFGWSQYYVALAISQYTRLQNSGPQAVIDLVQAKMQIAQRSLSDDMGTDLYLDGTGNSNKDLDGFGIAISDTGTYGGIDRSTETYWKSTINNNSGSGLALALARIRGVIGDVTIGADGPTLLVSTQNVYDKIWALYQANQRFVNTNEGFGGFTTLSFDGLPLVVDPKCPTDASDRHRMYVLNERYLQLATHPEENFRFSGWHEHIDKNGAVAKIFWAGNIVSSNCRMQARIDDIDPA